MSIDARIQRSIVSNLSRRPRSREAGPFVVGWDPGTTSRFTNYATPLPDAEITTAGVGALVTAFREFGGVPRLEYVVSTAPTLELLLAEAGFTIEARHDYLICTPRTLAGPHLPEGFALMEPATDADREAQIAVQNAAFGGEPTASPSDVARLHRSQKNGGVSMLARRADGRCVAGGQATPPTDGVSEVAGIAVAASFRRRGLAGALTAAVTARLFEAGADLAWLEASGGDSWRVYERVGYVPTGKRLYLALEE